MTLYAILGRVVSHGYLASGILPDRIAVPTLIAVLLCPHVKIPTNIMIQALIRGLY